jgi:G3E family GTPase
VATISQILGILEREDLVPLYSGVRCIQILDGSEFLTFVKSHRHFVENQLRAADMVILNKTDRIKSSMTDLLINSVKEINPDARVFPASFAKIDPDVLSDIFAATGEDRAEDARVQKVHEHEHEHNYEHDHHHEHNHEHDHHGHAHGLAEIYQPFGFRYPKEQIFDLKRVHDFFESLRDQKYGEVVRAKGIFMTNEAWTRLELASGEVSVGPGPVAEESIVSIIGQFINTEAIEDRLNACRYS